MTTDPRIEAAAKAIYDIRDDEFSDDEWADLDSTDRELYLCQATAALAAADKAATITTVEGLDALPVGSVILDSIGLALQLRYDGCWWCTNGDTSVTPEDIDREGLPARVLHRGTE